MRYIVVRTVTKDDGSIEFQALTAIAQKPNGTFAEWIEFSKAKTNYRNPEQCDLLSFDDRDDLEQNLEIWQLDESSGIVGVEAEIATQ